MNIISIIFHDWNLITFRKKGLFNKHVNDNNVNSGKLGHLVISALKVTQFVWINATSKVTSELNGV